MVFAAQKPRCMRSPAIPQSSSWWIALTCDTQINGDLSEQDRDDFARRAAKMAVLGKNLEGVHAVVQHRVMHFQTKVEPNGFKAQVVTFDRKCCGLLKFSIAFRVAGGQPV
jgi:hypothetical protein